MIERVVREGAFAAAALDAELGRTDLDQRDRALATELVYGVLRTRTALLSQLRSHASRGLPKDELVQSHLAVAAYQILLLDRVPAFAAVDAAVGAIAHKRGERLAGFVNAILRRLVDSGRRLTLEGAIIASCPAWLLRGMEESVGEEQAHALLGVRSGEKEVARVAVRVRSGIELPSWLAAAEHGRVSPRARYVARSGDLRQREGYDEGAFVVQEEGAQVAALAVGARSGERVLDACAGRGQKTSLLAEQLGADGELWAVDLHPRKLQALRSEFARLRLPPPKTSAVDWNVGIGGVPDGFDRVLVDAPCSGTGTLRHRPEIALRLREEDVVRLASASSRILRGAASRAKIGGRVLFTVCSVLRAECEDVAASVADVLEPAPFDAPEIASVLAPLTSVLRLSPLSHGTDGFFIASFRRKK